MTLDEFIDLRNIRIKDDKHRKVVTLFYPYLRSISNDDRLLPSLLENILNIDLSNTSVVTACFNGVNDGSKPPYDNADLYVKLSNDIQVFIYGRKPKSLVPLKENKYVICMLADKITSNISRKEKHHIFIE